VIVAGLVLLAFFASYGWAVSARPDVVTATDGLDAPAGYAGDPECSCCATDGGERIEGRTTVEAGVQRVYVDAAFGYSPNVIRAVAGMPIEITFSEGDGCMAEVVFPGFDIFEDLTRGGAVITLPVLEPGEYSFSCGMQMVFGTLVVE